MKDLHYLKATDLLQLIRTQQISAREVMQNYLERIDDINPVINGLIEKFSPEACLAEADKVDKDKTYNNPLKRLAGLPVTIKNVLNVKGLICSAGSEGLYKMGPSNMDATIVKRLKEAGAIIIGLTNIHMI
jgi:amidase